MQETYLVTGSAGFIGSNLIRYLMYNHNCKIVGIDKLEYSGSMNNVYANKSHNFCIGDVCDRNFINKVFELFRPSKVIHLASPLVSKVSEETLGLENVLECVKKFDVSGFSYVSSSNVYDYVDSAPVKENGKLKALTISSVSKNTAEQMIPLYNVPYNILRAPEVFGPRQHEGFFTCLISNLKCGDVVTVGGNWLDVRDLLYVEDLCQAIDLTLSSPSNRILNVSFGNEFSDYELAFMVINPAYSEELKSKLVWSKSVSNELVNVKLDSSAIRELGWKPLKKFRERIKFTTNWYANNEWALRIPQPALNR